jgi:hypothetical protein
VPESLAVEKRANKPTAKVKLIDRNPPHEVVRDSVVNLGADPVMSPALPEKHDDSTFLMADDAFTSRASTRNRERSHPELKALADRLPDDDLRRELALEVVKLREQLKAADDQKQRDSTRGTGRKIVREDRPESGSFHIPANQVNTIVRRAAGTDQIEVHMPGRDEEAQDLKVLRRDSVRGQKTTATPTDRIALAQDYIDATQIARPSLFKPLATWLGVAVILGIIAWAVHLAWQSFNGENSEPVRVTSDAAGGYSLGSAKADYEDLRNLQAQSAPAVLNKQGWLIQYDESSGAITGVAIPATALAPPKQTRFELVTVEFEGDTYPVTEKLGASELAKRFNRAKPEFSEAVWKTSETYTVRFETKQGDRALEFCFRTRNGGELLWLRLVDTKAEPKSPTESDFR